MPNTALNPRNGDANEDIYLTNLFMSKDILLKGQC